MPVKRIVLKKSHSGASRLTNSHSPEGAASAEDGVPVRQTGIVTRSIAHNARVKRIKLVNRSSVDHGHTRVATRSMVRHVRAKRFELVNRDSRAAPAVPALAPDGPDPNLPSVIKVFSNGRISLIRHVADNRLVYRRSDGQSDVVEYYHDGRRFKLCDTRTRLVIYESLADHPIISSGGRVLPDLYYDVYYRHYHFTYPLELLENTNRTPPTYSLPPIRPHTTTTTR
ncbi:hypothetical protein DL771_001878 [Monosporascus sp. 5C6A]|nr:hypothetical protein DL771_001878 [Monosporascus sp. 5C6A]